MSEVTGLSVRVLGPVQAYRAGASLDIVSRRQRALLAALAVRGGKPVSVGELVDAVWDDDPPERARTTLQTYVSRLRGALGQEAILHDAAGYRLAADVSIDVATARSEVARLERLTPGDSVGRANTALGVLELWHGQALGEFADHEWFLADVVELSEMRANLVDIAAQGLVESGRAPQAIALLEASLAADPLREPTQVLLMRALHAAGRTTDAVRAASRYRRRLADETGLVPGAALVECESLLIAGDVPARPSAAPASSEWWSASLSRPTPLIGRAGELDELRHLLGRSRLVTVTGTGGVGKTRLVAELIDPVDRHPGAPPVLVVELAPLGRGSVAASIGSALGYRAGLADLRTVADLLRRERLLLVLDNAEHVLSEVRGVVRPLLDSCPGVQVLVTSRARLALADEVVLSLDPLSTDGDRSDAGELFVDRVLRARPRSGLECGDPLVELLCRRLDGVPLALELAASRAAVLGVEALVDRLDPTVDTLVDVDPDRGRHETLGNVVAWSVDLLGASAHALLSALSVFRGEFDLRAAEAVGGAIVDDDVSRLLGQLVDMSLVATSAVPGRFHLLEMVRSFAAERFVETDRVAEVRTAHARWVATCLAEIDARSTGPDEAATVARRDEIRHETKAAVRWAVDSGDLDTVTRIVVALAGPLLYRPDHELIEEVRWVCSLEWVTGAPNEAALSAAGARAAFLLGDLVDVDRLAERALELAGDDPASRHRAEHALGVVRLYQGRFAESADWFERIVADPLATVVHRLDALSGLALARCYQGDSGSASDAADQHRGLSDAVGSETHRAFGDYVHAEMALASGDIDAAVGSLTLAAERAWTVRAEFVWGVASTVLAGVLVRHRLERDARRHLPGLLRRWRRTATWPQLWTTLRLVAEHFASTGDQHAALLILEAAHHDPAAPSLAGDDLARDAELRAQLVSDLGEATASGIVTGATMVDRVSVLDRAVAALQVPLDPHDDAPPSSPPVGAGTAQAARRRV